MRATTRGSGPNLRRLLGSAGPAAGWATDSAVNRVRASLAHSTLLCVSSQRI